MGPPGLEYNAISEEIGKEKSLTGENVALKTNNNWVSSPNPERPFVERFKSRHGRLMYYFRRGKGARIRLPDNYGTEEFWAAYATALAYHRRKVKHD